MFACPNYVSPSFDWIRPNYVSPTISVPTISLNSFACPDYVAPIHLPVPAMLCLRLCACPCPGYVPVPTMNLSRLCACPDYEPVPAMCLSTIHVHNSMPGYVRLCAAMCGYVPVPAMRLPVPAMRLPVPTMNLSLTRRVNLGPEMTAYVV
ncbi:MAG: hypothetical protein ACI9W2_001917 [Gammaproteobacteria bacterium]|jgi:hypothetical protein